MWTNQDSISVTGLELEPNATVVVNATVASTSTIHVAKMVLELTILLLQMDNTPKPDMQITPESTATLHTGFQMLLTVSLQLH